MTSSRSNQRLGEFALIAELFAPLAKSRNAFGLKDDAATIAVAPGQELVVTTDAIVSGVHFLESDPAETVAKKALRVNLSDLAAKGAKPVGYLLVLALPPHVDTKWLRLFAKGLGEDQRQFSLSLFGGDTSTMPGPLTIAITAFGSVPKGKMIRRAGAKAGDFIFVTGTIGDGAGGLAVEKGAGRWLSHSVRDHLIHRYRIPQPRTALGPLLRNVASASLDVSDGLMADLGHIAETSKVRVVVDAVAVPRSGALHALWGDGTGALVKAVTGGDDYEIAFTAPPRRERQVMAAAAKSGVPISRIGYVEKGSGVVLRDAAEKSISLPAKGWTHF
jgi:thiamine-monophosphate kinase